MQDTPALRVFSTTRLREATSEAGLTQQGVAFRLGMSMRGVQSWFIGKTTPSGPALIALAELLDREPAWFYENGDLPEPA